MVRVGVGAGGRRNVKRWIKENLGFDATADQEQRIWASELHEPTLINMDAKGIMDAEFDGEPWFGRQTEKAD